MGDSHVNIRLRRGTAAEWAASAPQPGGEVLKLGEPGYETDTKKLKIGDGTTPWNSLGYIMGGPGGGPIIIEDIDHLVSQILVPGDGINLNFNDANDELIISTTGLQPAGNYSVVGHSHIISDVSGLQTALDGKQASGNYSVVGHTHTSSDITDFVSAASGAAPVKSVNGMVGDVIIPGGGASNLSDLQDVAVTGILNQQVLKYNGSDWVNAQDGLGSITIDGVPGTTYKGFQASYGRVHSNSSNSELNLSKIVIYKETPVTTTIDPTSSNDTFQVEGLNPSNIVAMFVLYGDTNGPKEVSTLKSFAESVIDNVLLNGGVEGSFNTISDMRSAFYNSASTLTIAADGLYTQFQFFNNTYTVTTTGGVGSNLSIYFERNPTNGLLINPSISDGGSGWANGSNTTIPGTSIGGVSPDDDIAVTIDAVNEFGGATSITIEPGAVIPGIWPTNSISDGGLDQYDNANYISTNLESNINYDGGQIIVDGTSKFGSGSSYCFTYIPGIFGLLVTGNSANLVRTSGNSGADGSSTTDSGDLYNPSTLPQTFDNAITHINLTGVAYIGQSVDFVHSDNGSEIDILIADDGYGSGVGITRANNQGGIYNPYREGGWDYDASPDGTLWNIDGWNDLSNVTTRSYSNLYAAFGSGGLGNKIVGTQCVMYLPDNGKYYTVKFTQWTQGGNGGGFAYTRRELDVSQLQEGIRFADGTRLTSATGLGPVKSTAANDRRIEEVTGYKVVSVTARDPQIISTTLSRSVTDGYGVWIDIPTSLIDEIIENPTANGAIPGTFYFSFDNNTWYKWSGSTGFAGSERNYSLQGDPLLNYNIGDPIYFRYDTGGSPVVWWDSSELPSGSTNFRGAIIDYHAYSGEGTIIGTIHIVDDSGEDHISHTEVSSGSTDSENDDLWLVQNEGTISYRRIDGESKTLKVHWSAKVFYGSEFYD